MKLRPYCHITSELRIDVSCSVDIPPGLVSKALETLAKRLEEATPKPVYDSAEQLNLVDIAAKMMGGR
jgi:hypothetical protein